MQIDLEFVRRIYRFDGLAAFPRKIQALRDDPREMRVKRDEMIDQLIGSPEYVDFWANKWSDLLQCNSKIPGRGRR